MSTVLMVGTRKGMWIGTADDQRHDWEFTGPHFDMEEVYSCLIDKRGGSPRLFAGASSMWLGPQVSHSDDLGASWDATPGGAIRFPEGTDATLEWVWQLAAGPEDGVVYAGSEPAAIWKSTDRGETFALERALWDHPHRPEWGAGFGGQAFHTVLPHPTDPESVTAALSTGGVYQTNDGGASWEPRNQGIRAEFMPEGEQYPEFGQCVHKVTRHPARPERLFLQNHGGVYRSDDEGDAFVFYSLAPVEAPPEKLARVAEFLHRVNLGLVTETRETEGRRRRVFAITPAGTSALGAWLDRPSGAPTELRDPGLLQLFFADLASADAKRRLAERQLAIHEAKLAAYREADRHERRADGPQRGQRTVEHWRGETLPMGLRYESGAVDFWADVLAKAAAAAEAKPGHA